ncbi:phage portal protein [Pseudomonas arsenicoxydans]|uniref:Phage portal protein n=1 Tax=Pseudomonas arsenicoxydans TaxID=702115 RepID=A0A502HRB7_9PSED|nr:phage portal protein [Pseudomonas arsenicoxydans]TPG76323.1 phage portal protein [Pseudomonas arsenicoxydans]
MNIFGLTLGRKATKPSAEKTVASPVRGALADFLLSSDITPGQAVNFYKTVGPVAVSVEMIAGEVEKLTPVLIRKSDKKIDSAHDVVSLLLGPNGFESFEQVIGTLARSYLLTASAKVTLSGNINRPPLELFAVRAGATSSQYDQNDGFARLIHVTSGPIQGVYLREEKRNRVRYLDGAMREVGLIQGYASRSGADPDSPLNACAMDARQSVLSRQHNLGVLSNGGRLSLVFLFKDSVGEEEMNARRERIHEDFSGSGNAGKISVIQSGDLEIKEAAKGKVDMDFSVLDRASGDAIYTRFKIPLPLVRQDAATYDNMRQSVFQLYDRAVLPLARTLLAGLSRVLLPRYGIDPAEYVLGYDEQSIAPLYDRMIEVLEKRKKIGVETINELRAEIPGREPIEGGDALYQPSTLVPVGTDIFTTDNETVFDLKT